MLSAVRLAFSKKTMEVGISQPNMLKSEDQLIRGSVWFLSCQPESVTIESVSGGAFTERARALYRVGLH